MAAQRALDEHTINDQQSTVDEAEFYQVRERIMHAKSIGKTYMLCEMDRRFRWRTWLWALRNGDYDLADDMSYHFILEVAFPLSLLRFWIS
jgi:hypothetical protein